MMKSMISRLIAPIINATSRRLDAWLAHRIPANSQQQLTNRNIFIFPTRFGLLFLGFVLLLFIMGTNYKNNLILLVSYLMASLFVISIFHSFFNMLGLKVEVKQSVSGIVGDIAYITLNLHSNRARYHINAYFNGFSAKPPSIDCLPNQLSPLTVELPLTQRGLISPPRIIIQSYFALGLIRTWTRLDFGTQVLAIPKPRKTTVIVSKNLQSSSGKAALLQRGEMNDEFQQLKPYLTGDTLAHVSWKHLAKGLGMLTKEYYSEQGDDCWLNIVDIQQSNIEQKLEVLVYWILEFEKSGQMFGLDLGVLKIAPSCGKDHIQQCLTQVACYGQ